MRRRFSPRPTSPRLLLESGSALLLILGCIALLTLLIVAFLVTARTEFSSSNFYLKGVSTKLLSENAINMVIAQLREGARSTDVTSGNAVAWASQPGMIRTYDSTGNPYKFYKLYSWDNMDGTGAFDETQSTEQPPTTWATLPGVYTDLNEPVNGLYPIINPSAANADGTTGPVEGFSYTPQTASSNPIPMPVKWLYVLKDGTVETAAPASGTTVTVANASATNPIIGRMAFWTDDETSKVNINTASEGTFWDVPVSNNSEEMGTEKSNNTLIAPFGFASAVPGAEEFQRMPGHPATTCLSTVFGSGTSPVMPAVNSTAPIWPLTAATYTSTFASYYSLTPRYAAGGSLGGVQAPTASFTPPSYRLYDSIDELIFDPQRTALTSANTALYPSTTPNFCTPSGRGAISITPQVLERSRFFITAHSRAPEETLFGTPRISLWPIQAESKARTPKDNLLAFCSTIAGNPYYFQRATYYQYQATSASAVTGGSGGVGSSQSATLDFPGSPSSSSTLVGAARNQNIYAYLQALTSNNIPGFGSNFLAKYPSPGSGVASDRDQILTEMFDLIRSGVNTYNNANLYPHYTYSPMNMNGGTPDPACSGSTVPIQITTSSGSTRGLGRTYNIGQISLVFMAAGIDTSPSPAGTIDSTSTPNRKSIGIGLPWAVAVDNPAAGALHPVGSYLNNAAGNPIGDPQTTQIQAFLLIRPYILMEGTPPCGASVRIQVSNLDQLTATFGSNAPVSLGLPAAANAVEEFNLTNNNANNGSSGLSLGFMLDPIYPKSGNRPVGPNTGVVPAGANPNYPFVGSVLTLPAPAYPSPFGGQDGTVSGAVPIHFAVNSSGGYAGTTFSTNAVQLKIQVLDGTASTVGSAQIIQTLYVNIPAMTSLPVPTVEMANGTTSEGLNVEFEAYGGKNSTPARLTDPTQIAYYYQLPYSPMDITQRFTVPASPNQEYNYTRLISRGDTVRSSVPNPNSKIGGDMRLLATMPPPTSGQTTWPGDTGNDLFIPLGGASSTYSNPVLGPYTSPFIRQLHSLLADGGDGRFCLNLTQTSQSIMTSAPLSSLVLPVDLAGIGQSYGYLFPGEVCAAGSAPDVTPELNGAFMDVSTRQIPGDWTMGIGPAGDGPFISKPDEGFQGGGTNAIPYFNLIFGNLGLGLPSSATSYSPTRQVPSPLIFGTLPSRAMAGIPYCTLLFCPNPAANDNGSSSAGSVHPGFGTGSGTPGPGDYPPYTTGAAPYYGGPPDHLWLDLFWMPVVEPYAISEPFSTAGKVNMNYEMVPFGNYIHRSTGVHAVLKSTRLLAVPTTANSGTGNAANKEYPQVKAPGNYHSSSTQQTTTAGFNYNYRYNINLPATIDDANSAFQVRFKTKKDIFRSASEICNVFLVPQAVPGSTYDPSATALPGDASYATMQAWWANFKLTGDNGRESPYNQIYPRLTTKSNTFQVHMRVQVLTQTPSHLQNGTFDLASGDSITGEYRGSAIVERYVDPNQTSPALPDFATAYPSDPTATLDAYCHYRIVSTHSFNP